MSDGLKELSRREGVTPFTTLLAAFHTLLGRYTGQQDIVVGSPIAGRTQAETEGLVGFFINTLALRLDLSGDPTFVELLHRAHEVALGAFAHQDLPFEKLVEELQPERDLRHTPIFQVALAYQNFPSHKLELPGLTLQSETTETGNAKFDLMLYMWQRADGLRAVLEYNLDLFDAGTIIRMLSTFQDPAREHCPEPQPAAFPVAASLARRKSTSCWTSGTPPPRIFRMIDRFIGSSRSRRREPHRPLRWKWGISGSPTVSSIAEPTSWPTISELTASVPKSEWESAWIARPTS